MLTNNPRIVTNGLVGNWDPVQSQYPPRGIATTWAYYSLGAAHSNPIGTDGVYLKTSSTGWVGYFHATVPSTGEYTVMFDYVTDVANTNGLVLDNDGISDNLYNASIDTTTSVQHFQKTVNITVAGGIYFYCRRNAGGNITITNFRYFKNEGAYNPGAILFDSAGGSDGRGSGNNGTMYNGTCLDLDGSDDYVLVPDGGTYGYTPGNGSWTISMWVNADVFSDNTLLSNTSGSPVTSAFYISTAGKIAFTNYDGAPGWQVHAGDTTLSTGTWYLCTWVNYAGSLSTNATMKMFVNGVADSSEFGSVYTTNGGPVDAIGRITSSYFNGKIADVRFYDVAFSDANVKEIYDDSKVIIPTKSDASGGFADQTNLKRWWPLVDGAGTIAYDGSGNGNDGTLTNMDAATDWLTGQTGCPQLVEGYNRPLLFKESDSIHVDWTNTQSLDDITLSAWICPTAHNSYNPIIRLGGAFFLLNGTGTSLRLVDGWATSPGIQAYTFSLNTWYHVAATRVRSGNQILYVNGSQIKSEGASSSSISMSLVEIGKRSTNYFNGLINEVVVYDGALGATEIAKLAARDPNGGPLPPDPVTGVTGYNSVLGYYRNDGDVTWADRSGHAGAGVATVYGSNLSTLLFKQGYNGQKSTSTGRDGQGFPLKFKNNGAMGFDGSNNYVNFGTCPTILEIAQTSETTMLAWVKVGPHSGEIGIMSAFYSTGAAGWSWVAYQSASNPCSSMLVDDQGDSSGTWIGQALPRLPEMTDDGTWHQTGITIRRTAGSDGQVYFFQDGIKNSTPTYVGSDNGATAWGSGRDLSIGRSSYYPWGEWSGQIANIQIYKTILTDAQILQNFNAQRSRFNV